MSDNTIDIIKEKERKRQIIIANLITAGIALVIGSLIFVLYFFLNEEGKTIKTACNASAIAGITLVCSGVLCWLARLGAFDTFAFGFIQMGTSLFSKNPLKRDTLVEYKEKQIQKRKDKSKYYFVIIGVGVLFLIALLVLEILFNIKYK